ncbi:ABC transporter substrate-binding protein, partial [Pseudonocardia sulfidoxydans]
MLGSKRRRAWLGAVLAAIAVTAGCAGGGQPAGAAPVNGGTFTMAVSGDLSDIDPQRSPTQWIQLVHYGNVSETLATLDPGGKLVPLLATEWSQTQPQVWRFKLRPGVKYQNGETFDAAAVKYSLDRITSPDFGAEHVGFFASYDRTEIIDPTTVEIHTKVPDAEFPLHLTFAPMVPPAYTAAGPKDVLDKAAIGTGPYLMDSRTTDRVVLKKNPNYWGEIPATAPDQVVLLARPEDGARLSGLQAGEIDVANLPPFLVKQAPRYQTAAPAQKLIVSLNAYAGVTANPKVREAIVLATDNEGIRQALLGDDFSVPGLCQLGVDGISGFTAGLQNQRFDPDRARQLIQEAGAQGATFRLATPAGRWPQDREAAELVVEQLNAVGLNAQLMTLDFQTYLKTIFAPKATRVEAFLIGASFDSGSVAQPYGAYLT